MAVVFISPKQRQRMFFMIVTVMFLLFLAAISLGVLLAKPKKIPASALVFNKPKVNIDMRVFETEQFKNLEPFSEMKMQYSYRVTDKKRKQISGFISAVSIEQAKKDLEAQGFTVLEIKEVGPGRDNPFIPYYQITSPAKSK